MKGTTPSWQRPVRVEIELPKSHPFIDIHLAETLAEAGMAQSKAEAKRLIEQKIIWIDRGVAQDGEFIWDRLEKITGLENNKMFLVERGDIICVGKTIDEAIAHRIVFI